MLASASEDGSAFVYSLPEDIKSDITEPTSVFDCEGKITQLRFHPFVSDVLVSCSTNFDNTLIQFWDVKEKKIRTLVKLPKEQVIIDLAFHSDSSTLAVTCKDGKTRIIDVRAVPGKQVLSEFEPAEGVRDTQIFWVNDRLVVTIGFGKMSKRSISLWDFQSKQCLASVENNTSTSIMLPYFDIDTGLLWTANSGGRTFVTYLIGPQSPYIEQLNEWLTCGDLTGAYFFPKYLMDVKKAEVGRALKLGKDDSLITVPFTVPRKRLNYFQDDLFMPTRAPQATMTADEFFAGEKKEIIYMSLQPDGMTELSKAPPEELTENQKKYQQRLIDEEKARQEKVKGATGHTNATEVQQHFKQVAQQMPTRNRWDATQDKGDDVDASEW